jgi:GNAT superfamily N-acetyltransferase
MNKTHEAVESNSPASATQKFVLGPQLHRAPECEAVLRSLPLWFGIEESLQMYVRDTETMPTFAIELEKRVVAFATLQQHFPKAWEVHCLAVMMSARGAGLGRQLLGHVELWLRDQGARFLQIKTVAPSHPSPQYAETRKFYETMGYTPLEVFPTIWSPRDPALQLVKALGAA